MKPLMSSPRSRFRCLAGEPTVERRPRRELLGWVTWYWFFIATAVLFIGLRYPLTSGFPEGAAPVLFTLGLSLGHWYSLAFLISVLLFYPLVILLPLRRLITVLAMLLGAAAMLTVVIDTFVFAIYRFHINGIVISLLFGDAGSEIFVFGIDVYLTALAIVAAVLFSAYFLGCLAWRMSQREGARRLGPLLGLGLFAVFLGQNFFFAWADAAGDVRITSQARLYPLYMPVRAQDFFYDNGLVDPAKVKKRVGIKAGAVDYPREPLQCSAVEPRPDIFFIVVDSWRYDEVSEAVTPNISAFADEATVYQRHYSGGNNTRTGLFSLFYGLPATYWETFLDERAGSAFVGQLLENDYELAIYASAKLTGPEFDRTIFADVVDLRKQTEADGVYARDVKSTDEFMQHLEGSDASPLFGFLFYDAPHTYVYDEQFADWFQPAAESMNYFNLGKETDPTPYRNLYRRAVRSADKQVGRALDAIRKSGRWDDAIIVVTADHGQEFNDNGMGYWGHNGNFTDAQIRVPLMIKWPGHEPEQVDYTTTHYDITTTLMQRVFGCATSEKDYSLGTSLFSDESRYGFVVGGFGDFGVRMQQRIYWVDKFGSVHTLDDANRALSAEPDGRAMVRAMEETTRFYK